MVKLANIPEYAGHDVSAVIDGGIFVGILQISWGTFCLGKRLSGILED